MYLIDIVLFQGQIVGIPKKIGRLVAQYLVWVIQGERPIIDPEDELELQNPVHIYAPDGTQLPGAHDAEARPDNGPWMEKRTYRDSAYAIMASMYTQLRPEAYHQLKTNQVQQGMRPFTDLEVAFDHRSGRHGAFKGMEKMVADGLVRKEKGGGKCCSLSIFLVCLFGCILDVESIYS